MAKASMPNASIRVLVATTRSPLDAFLGRGGEKMQTEATGKASELSEDQVKQHLVV